MNKQILSLVALPTILASTVPALADTPVQVVQPIVKPLISPQVPILQQGFANPIDGVIAPGPGGTTVKPRKPPKPPKREIDGFQLQNLPTLSKPATINENINVDPVQKF